MFLDVVISWLHLTVTIAVSRAWAISTLSQLAVSSDRAGPRISFGAPADDRMSIAASEGELGSGDDDSAALPPSGRVELPESDPKLTAMLSRAAESVGLHWRPPPSTGTVHSDGPRPKGDESHSAGPGSDDVHVSGP